MLSSTGAPPQHCALDTQPKKNEILLGFFCLPTASTAAFLLRKISVILLLSLSVLGSKRSVDIKYLELRW